MPALDELLSTLQLRVLVASRMRLWPDWKVDEHALPCNKIYFPYGGRGAFALDGREHMLRPRHVALLPAKRQNRCWQDPRDPVEKIWVHFDARVLGLVDLFDVLPCPAPFDTQGDPEIQRLLEALVEEAKAPAPYQGLAQTGMLALILARILRLAEKQKVPAAIRHPLVEKEALRGPGDRIGAVLEHIAAHYAKDLSLEDLAKVVHLHPTYFSNHFRKATGVAPMAFLQKFRIERAKGLLSTSDLTVAEAGAKVGFPDPYHFSRVFKKLTGSAPKAFQDSVRRTSNQ